MKCIDAHFKSRMPPTPPKKHSCTEIKECNRLNCSELFNASVQTGTSQVWGSFCWSRLIMFRKRACAITMSNIISYEWGKWHNTSTLGASALVWSCLSVTVHSEPDGIRQRAEWARCTFLCRQHDFMSCDVGLAAMQLISSCYGLQPSTSTLG